MAKKRAEPYDTGAVQIKGSAAKELDAIPAKHRDQILDRIRRLGENPHPLRSKKMEGKTAEGEPYYREVSGGYRIFYIVRGSAVIVIDVSDRKDAYTKKGRR